MNNDKAGFQGITDDHLWTSSYINYGTQYLFNIEN